MAQRPASQESARNVVKPEALTEVVKLLRWFHSFTVSELSSKWHQNDAEPPRRRVRFISISEIDKRRETDWIEAGAAYEESVDLRLRHETLRVVRFDAATV